MTTYNVQFTALDANTNLPIEGAELFINGRAWDLTSDSSGRIPVSSFLVLHNTYSFSVKAKNYDIFTKTVTIVLATNNITVSMQKSASSPTVSFTLNVSPDTENGQPLDSYSITFDNAGNPVSLNYVAGGIQFLQLTPGTQNVTGSPPGFDPINISFNVGPDPTKGQVLRGTINLKNSNDAGLATQEETQATQDPDVNALVPDLTPEDVPEFIAPNTGQGTYFTMTQARMYIGTMFIDELSGLQFVLQDNKIPIYGYASRYYDAIAQGKSLVQGQFAINFISEGYLYTVLKEYANTVDTGDSQIDKVAQQQQARLNTLVNGLQNPDPTWTPAQIANIKQEIQNLASTLGIDALIAAKAGMAGNNNVEFSNALQLPGGDYPNAVYKTIPFDIVLQYTGAGRTVIRRLENVRLISNESIMDHSGTPILDSYGFIARRVR